MDNLIKKMLLARDYAVQHEPFCYELSGLNFDNKNLNDYIDFLAQLGNGGFFFHRSFQIYGFSDMESYTNANYINGLIQKYFGSLADNLFAFAQDIFGNQFAFEHDSSDVIYFNTETGEREIMAGCFREWMQVLERDLEYYTGEPLMIDWIREKGEVDLDTRLVPIKPFVIGGDYEVSNLHALHFPKYLDFYADIAKQISMLPDGAIVKLVIKNIS